MSLRTVAIGLVSLTSLVSLAGCGDAPEPGSDEQVASVDQFIKGGYADDFDHAVVGVVNTNGGFGLCSGTLIAPNLVVTARHCVSSSAQQIDCSSTKFGTIQNASNFYVTTLPEFTQEASNYHQVQEIIGLPVETKLVCGNDQALLILEDLVPFEEAKPYVPRVDSPSLAGDEYYAVGFGATNDSGSGSGQRRRRDGLFIDCVADECPSYGVKETEWVGDTGICSGDSGGPALDLQNRVIGTTSRGAAGCEHPVYGYIFGWSQWIKDTAIYAAGLGAYPPPFWATGWPTDPQYDPNLPIGGECQEPADCPSGHCILDPVANYCTRACIDIAPCPDQYYCDLTLGVCIWDHPAPPPEEKPKASDQPKDAVETGGCSTSGPKEDPTKPIPWKAAVLALAGVALAMRRRR